MPLRTPRFLLPLLAFFVLGACSSEGYGPFEPLSGGTALPVSLATTITVAAGSAPRLQISGLRGEALVVWDVESAPCLLAAASALRSGNVIEVHIRRSGDPAALCAPGSAAYHYEARVQVAASGAYEVRLVDDLLGQPPRSVGRLLVAVLPLL
jgi:hypothetical protein